MITRWIGYAGLSALLGLLALPGCDGDTRTITPEEADAQPPTDAQPGDGAAPDAAAPARDAAPVEEDASAPECVVDADCGSLLWCEAGACRPSPDSPVFSPPADGVTRAAAAAFELSPSYLEGWLERAGPNCPGNRPGRFDGRLDRPDPFDECADTFEDTNGDGRFDAFWTSRAMDTPATGVDLDNPPQGRVLILSKDETLWVLITLDVRAVSPGRIARLSRRLRRHLGVPAHQIAIHATGTRQGPDALGLWGPSLAVVDNPWAEVIAAAGPFPFLSDLPFQSGVSEPWWAEVEARCEATVAEAGRRLRPASVRWGSARLPMGPDPIIDGPFTLPDVDEDGQPNTARDRASDRDAPRWLSRDLRWPAARDHTLRSLALEGPAGDPIAHLVVWGSTPALSGPEPTLSAGLPGLVRQRIEADAPGTLALWLTGAVADTVITDNQVLVPAIDARGRLLGADGQPVEDLSLAAPVPEEDVAEALAELLAFTALDALGEQVDEGDLHLNQRYVWLPITNPRLGIAARLGLLPDLGGWLSGRLTTQRWAGADAAPACGGLGCLRHRLDRLRLGPVNLVTMPGAPSGAFAEGRGAGSMYFGDALDLTDLDGDGVADAEDPELLRPARDPQQPAITIHAPANPQAIDAVVGLAGSRIWLLGRTDGGLGSFYPAVETPNIFEGQLRPLMEYVADPAAAELDICAAGYPCADGLTLGALSDLTASSQPERLADLIGGHTLWLVDPPAVSSYAPRPWRLELADGDQLEGLSLRRLREGRAFTLEADFYTAGVQRGDLLRLGDEPPLTIGGLVPLSLVNHPNAADLWRSTAPDQGDLIYNTACALLFEGGCPHRRALARPDPNASLPRTP